MTEDQRGSWLIGGMQVGVRPTMRGVHFELRHAGDAVSLDPVVSARMSASPSRLRAMTFVAPGGLGWRNPTKKEDQVGKVVVTEFVSMDGVMEDPGGSEDFEHGGWSFKFDRGEEGDKFKLDETLESDALLLGRVTYQGFAEAWPSREGEFADKFNSMPKYVVSTTLDEAEWNNSTVLKGDVAEEVSKLKQEEGGDIVIHGSARLVQTLMEHDLIDEYRLMVFPVVLGSGKRLFGDTSDPTALKLVDSKPVGSDGVLILTYQPAGKDAEGSGS